MMPGRVPRKPRPKIVNIPKGDDSIWEYEIHQTVLKDLSQVGENLLHVVADAAAIKTYKNGTSVLLLLPAEKLWVLPNDQ